MKILRTAIFASLVLNLPSAHATSFDCNKGRSITEQLICHTADLSKLDDLLGKLYWQARRSVTHPRTFRADSDTKWAWREANCKDETCLRTWYMGRIEELQRLLASLRADQLDETAPAVHGTPRDPATPGTPATGAARSVLAHAQDEATTVARQCTAADPGITWHEQCPTVLNQSTRWQYAPRNGDWFCGVATVAQTPAEAR